MLFLACGSAKIIIQTQMILTCNCGFWNKIDYAGNAVSINGDGEKFKRNIVAVL